MCVAGLNVSTQSCAHRWYELVRACHPANNLANCPEKLKLEGWENRNASCPWCDSNESKVPESTHRLFGNTSSASSTSSSPSSAELNFGRPRRSDSNATMSPLSRHSSTSSMESDRGQRHRDMNERLNLYLLSHPHEILPSAAKNYPTYPQSPSNASVPPRPGPIRRTSSGLSRGWRQSMRMSMAKLKV